MARNPPFTLKTGKGINRDQLPSELAPGYWSDCQNMRFRNGNDERVGGVAAVFTTPAVIPYGLETFDVGTTTGTKRFLFQMGLAQAYVDDGTTQTEITRGLNGYISSISGAAGVVTVTTSAAHGLSTNDNVIIGGVTPTGYNTAVTGATITVTGATTFTYANATVAASTALGWWDSNRTSNFTAAAGEEITTAVLNGVLYVNTLLDGCYYWAGSTLTTAQGRLRRLRASTTSHVFGRSIFAYRDYLFVLGLFPRNNATFTGSTTQPYTIGWGASAEPGTVPTTFIAASTNDAGSINKTRGAVVYGKEWQGSAFVYHDRAVLTVSWTGGEFVFDTTRFNDESNGILAPNCVANTPAGQFFFSQNKDFMLHSGGAASSVAQGRVLQWIRDNIDSTYYARSFVVSNPRYEEVWLCIPTTGNSTCNKALIYNWKADTWGERDLSGVTCGTNGMLPATIATDDRVVIATNTPRIGLTDSGTTYFGASFTSMVERTGMDMGNPSSVKNLQGSRWQDDGTAGATSSVFHGSAMTADGAPTYTSAATATLGTSNWVNTIATGGRYLALKRTTTGAIGKCRSIDLDYTESGTH